MGVFGPNIADATLTTTSGDHIQHLTLQVNRLMEDQQLQQLRHQYGAEAVDAEKIRATAHEYGLTDFTAAFKIANFDTASKDAVDRYVQGKTEHAQAGVQGGGGAPSITAPEPPKTLEEARKAAAAFIAEAQRKQA